jgi:hypothetical protein
MTYPYLEEISNFESVEISKYMATKKADKKELNTIVSEPVGNYEKHPFFIKKAKAAKELLTKVGLPKHLAKKMPA